MQKAYKLGGLGGHSLSTLKTSGVYDGKIAGLYDLEETLGRGHFAVVKLARHVFTGEKVAVKVIDKSKLDNVSKAHLFQEVRCMKLVQHPNVVRLYEVIDTATKLYLILELGDGGDLYDYIMRHETGLCEQLARDYFAQIVRAITYCHQLHVVHRDLKPENVVFFEKLGVVKLTDFGFSNKFSPGQKLETSCGSLAYSAPEILLGDSYDAPAVDVWSLGVILYMLVCGQAPFHEANDSETLTMIMDCKYTVPMHISNECKELISKMLVRAPEKRASLAEIAAHTWLSQNHHENIDNVPLVSKEQLSEEDHTIIVQKMVNGNIATKEEIQDCIDKNDYNHITATYFLLAERKLRFKRQEVTSRGKRPENLAVASNEQVGMNNKMLHPTPMLLSVPRTPGDVPQRTRKCSIVQEDEEEEDISSSGREELNTDSLNRRGSRSEGRINVALQERIAESERKKVDEKPVRVKAICSIKTLENRPRSAHETISNVKTRWRVHGEPSTTVIAVPFIQCQRAEDLFEEASGCGSMSSNRQMLNRGRRANFNKTRAASCSSSDASDDDSENRKKRPHKLHNTTDVKTMQIRRDSHDDSSDSQEPGTGASATGSSGGASSGFVTQTNQNKSNSNNKTTKTAKETSNSGRKHTNTTNGAMLGRRHKASRRRSSETRLRESQSLNRITEEQDGASANINILSSVAASGAATTKAKTFGAKFLGITIGSSKRAECEHLSRKDAKIEEKESKPASTKKMRLLGRYFQMHKRIFLPLPNLFSRGKLYKARSCGSLTKDKIVASKDVEAETMRHIRNSLGSTSDINQNMGTDDLSANRNLVIVKNGLSNMCAHLGPASKCSFC